MTDNHTKRGRPASYTMAPLQECIDKLIQVYEAEGEIPQTARHYYYGLKRTHMLELDPTSPKSSEAAYKAVIRLLAYARKSGLFPYYAVIDTSRRSLGGDTGWPSLQRYINSLGKGYYSVDPWRGQPRRIEAFVEKDGMANFLYNVVEPWRIPVYVNKGYASITMLREAAIRYQDGSKWLLLYVGDFDPSGLDIERRLRDAIYEYGGHPDIVRVALTHSDLATLDAAEMLPANPKDTRTKAFQDKYGTDQPCYQVESMPAGTLASKIEVVVKREIDEAEFEAAEQLEQVINERAAVALLQSVASFHQDLSTNGYIEQRHMKYLAPPETDVDNYSIRDIALSDDVTDELDDF